MQENRSYSPPALQQERIKGEWRGLFGERKNQLKTRNEKHKIKEKARSMHEIGLSGETGLRY